MSEAYNVNLQVYLDTKKEQREREREVRAPPGASCSQIPAAMNVSTNGTTLTQRNSQGNSPHMHPLKIP